MVNMAQFLAKLQSLFAKLRTWDFFGIVHLSGFGRIMCSRIILEMLRKTDALAEREFEAVVRSKNQRTHSQEDGNPTAMNEIKHVPTIGFCFQANQGRTFSVWVRGFLVCVYCIFSNTNFALIGTTQPDLAHLHDFTLSQMSFALSMFCVGAIIGSPIGSLLSTKFLNHFDIYFGILVAVFGLSILCIPFTPYCYLLSLLYGFQGMCTTMGNVSTITLIVLLWKERSTSWFSACALWHSVGDIMSPILASPFLSSKVLLPLENKESAISLTSQAPFSLGSNETMQFTKKNNQQALELLYVPFLVLAIFALVMTIIHFYLRCNFQEDFEARIVESDHANASIMRSETSCSQFKHFSCKWFFVVIMGCICQGIAMSREVATLNFSVTITSEAFYISTQDASLVSILFNTIRCVGRVVMIFLPAHFSNKHLVITYTIAPVILAVLLVVTGSNWWAYLVLMSLQTLFGSASHPLFTTLVIDIIPHDRSVAGIMTYCTGVGGLFGVWICGFLYETYGLMGFCAFVLGTGCFIMLSVLGLTTAVYYWKNRGEEATRLLRNEDEDCFIFDE
ncbi:hypothetical protein CAPTEDRAFT_206353 [Capitella teleta]|uniref:Major facilitator superfamily (MFS) profile domain-containing protein n=1 Tax=Capitella teleta TaxID=283909 RepID=R7UBD5_CAPTE|nr:hypothetical protein CAPTEDRAFT_206353 [Capitella teleta]|eukprot:ELU03680.1 hypothetical protein CAPTEDRAFT_206353 [Capitella teleta]